MADNSAWLAQKLSDEGARSLAFFEELPEGAWRLILYEDGATWTVRDILAHFVVTEIGIPQIMRAILAGGRGSPDDFDLDVYNRQHVAGLENVTSGELLKKFGDLRSQTVRFVAGMSAAELQMTGRHPFLGIAPLVDMIKLMYRHNQIHQRDIRRAIAAAASGQA
ncbi:MAG: DinB family protein [Anaerolineales bacterium]|jgi:hypothetical protein